MFFFSSRRRHTRLQGDWSSDVCSSDLPSIVNHLPSTIKRQPSTVYHPPSTINHPPSTVYDPPFTVHSLSSTHRPKSLACCPSITTEDWQHHSENHDINIFIHHHYDSLSNGTTLLCNCSCQLLQNKYYILFAKDWLRIVLASLIHDVPIVGSTVRKNRDL